MIDIISESFGTQEIICRDTLLRKHAKTYQNPYLLKLIQKLQNFTEKKNGQLLNNLVYTEIVLKKKLNERKWSHVL